MKKIIAVIIMLALLTLCACSTREEIAHELIDYRFTPAHHESITTTTVVMAGKTPVVIPQTYSYWREDQYELRYHVTYDDGSTNDIWEKVSQKEYDNAVKELGE